MFTLGTHFGELLQKIRPPQERLDKAKNLTPQVRDYLKCHDSFETIYPHSRLVGSYAQHLCVGDVKDVDFLVRLPGNPEEDEPEAKKAVQVLKRALDGLPEALGYEGFASIDVQRARRSVHVYFSDEDFHFDVVPCIAPNGFDDKLYVPDREFNKWIESHPIGYISLLEELDENHHDKVRPLIKLLKHYRNHVMQYRRPKSYWLGALVIHHMQNGHLDSSLSLAELFRDLCDTIYCQYDHLLWSSETSTPNIPDPMLGHNISWNWGRSHFETFMRRLDHGRKWAARALESDDRDEAIRLWQNVFGEDFFPTEVRASAVLQAMQHTPGKSYVLGSGLVVGDRPHSGVYSTVHETTFHGEPYDQTAEATACNS